MPIELNSKDIERWMGDQSQLKALATVCDVRAMHEELEQFYRTQLVAMYLAECLDDDA